MLKTIKRATVYGIEEEFAGKVCNSCGILKSEEDDFSNNSYAKNNRMISRGYCKECEKERRKHKISDEDRKKWERFRPKAGSMFDCPCCGHTRHIYHDKAVVLDHCSFTGIVLGWICGKCNTGHGKADDDPMQMVRLIGWRLQAINPEDRKKYIDELKKELDKCLEICYNTLYNDE